LDCSFELDCSFGELVCSLELDCSLELVCSAASAIDPKGGHPAQPIQAAPAATATTSAPRHEPRFFMLSLTRRRRCYGSSTSAPACQQVEQRPGGSAEIAVSGANCRDRKPEDEKGRACRPVPPHFASGGDGCRQSALGFRGLAPCLATETNHSGKHQEHGLNQRPEVASRWLNPNYFYFSAVTTWGTLCHLPGRRFHVALDFNPSSKGRAAVFA
jgi:hypothetical protein